MARIAPFFHSRTVHRVIHNMKDGSEFIRASEFSSSGIKVSYADFHADLGDCNANLTCDIRTGTITPSSALQ
jgi:hypothetical protein